MGHYYDGSGNVMALTNGAQQVVARYRYDAFGNAVGNAWPAGESTPTDTIDAAQQAQPYRYSTTAPRLCKAIVPKNKADDPIGHPLCFR